MTDLEHPTDSLKEIDNPTNQIEFEASVFVLRAIDQAVVDGLVDGDTRWVHIKLLTAIGFQGFPRTDETLDDFRQALTEDQRYIESDEVRYSYRPVLLGPTEAKPTARAIVRGTAIISGEARDKFMDFMNSAANSLIAARDSSRPFIKKRDVKTITQKAGFALTDEEEHALFVFMQSDNRFNFIKDGRIRVVDFSQEASPLRSLGEMGVSGISQILDQALDNIRVDYRGEFKFGSILGAFHGMGVKLNNSQIQQLQHSLRKSPRVMAMRRGSMRLISPTADDYAEVPSRRVIEAPSNYVEVPSERVIEASSLEKKIDIAFSSGVSSRKSRGRQNGKKTGYRAKPV